MSEKAEIQWLIDRWGLPKERVENVNELLAAEAEGSTALRLDGVDGGAWGRAAGTEEEKRPLVLRNGGTLLQSRRCYNAERVVAERILRMAGKLVEVDEGLLERVADLFPDAKEDSAQVKAVRTALGRSLTIITGGPGTGKTYTMARLLALLVGAGEAAERIQLAAPTGKAAERMRDAIIASLGGVGGLGEKEEVALERVARHSKTLHSLLGYNFYSGECRYSAKHPLPCETLIVDECSMVDLFLWRALFDALPEGARVILVGDPFQLQSVGQGNVFGEIVARAKEVGSELNPCLVRLNDSWRFKDRVGIRGLAEALEACDDGAVEKLMEASRKDSGSGLVWLETGGKELSYTKFPAPIRSAIESVAAATTPGEALEGLKKVCVLTAYRGAFSGAKGVAKMVSREMLKRLADTGKLPNEPVIISVNDSETGLRNGSVGVIHTDQKGRRRAWFDGEKSFPLGALPEYESAWAITIHRSQGSEYDDVLVFLPQEGSPLSNRELLYTAITRAKKNVYVVGRLSAIKSAVNAATNRVTGLFA